VSGVHVVSREEAAGVGQDNTVCRQEAPEVRGRALGTVLGEPGAQSRGGEARCVQGLVGGSFSGGTQMTPPSQCVPANSAHERGQYEKGGPQHVPHKTPCLTTPVPFLTISGARTW